MSLPPNDVPCRPEDLGKPIPATRHAVSVCLPTWADNLGYERGEARVVGRMQSGYPRFFLHPDVLALFRQCEQKFAAAGECCFAFPSRRVAERAVQFVRTLKGIDALIHPLADGSACCVRADAAARDELKAYWQHTGQVISSRVAERIVANRPLSADGAKEKSAIRDRVARLMNVDASDVWLFPSGMAAIETAFRVFQRLRPDAKSVQFGFPYVDSLKVQERCGKGVHFFPRGDATELAQLGQIAAGEPLLGLFCEFPGNPLLASSNLRGIDALARKHDFPVLVDDTLGALVNVDVLPVADVVTCSLTKFFSGAGDVIGGSLVVNPRRAGADRLRRALVAEYEDLLDPEDAAVLERNSRDCVERVRRINRTAEQLCDVLHTHPLVERVDYPKFRDRENYRAFQRPDGGYGGLFSLLLKNAERTAPRFFDALQIAKGPNLGTNFSLCCPYTILAHFNELDFVERCGISRYLVRVSVGLEEADALIPRFLQALQRATEEPAG
ncbi:MAG TPA: PLP-dependent transferase [Planctomycetaceae bacterium]|nr:PLP-dependent transferase [Planctomycetaceae bacterium]